MLLYYYEVTYSLKMLSAVVLLSVQNRDLLNNLKHTQKLNNIYPTQEFMCL